MEPICRKNKRITKGRKKEREWERKKERENKRDKGGADVKM